MKTSICTGLQRPTWITSQHKQVVIIIRDASPSMENDNKAIDAQRACEELVSELAKPINKDGFIVGIVDFWEKAVIKHELLTATQLENNISSIEIDGATNITAGLEKGLKLLESTQESSLRPIILLFTDGEHNTGKAPHKIAEKLKQVADVVTVAFGDDADEKLLKELASTEQHFYKCSNGNELRQFMASVGQTMSMAFTGKKRQQLTKLQ